MTLFLHYLRRSLAVGLLALIAVIGFQVAACLAFNQVQIEGDPSLISKLMPKWMQTALNLQPDSFMSLRGLYGLLFQHPVFLVIIFAVPVTLVTSLVSGDVDRGSLAMLLARPMRRITVPLMAAFVTLVWIITLMAGACLGISLGVRLTEMEAEIPWPNVLFACANIGLLAWAVCGIAVFFCCQPMNRGDATSWTLTVLVCLYVWNFLAPIWGGKAQEHNYSLFRYLNPPSIFTQNVFDMNNLLILGGVGFAGLLIGSVIFARREFHI